MAPKRKSDDINVVAPDKKRTTNPHNQLKAAETTIQL